MDDVAHKEPPASGVAPLASPEPGLVARWTLAVGLVFAAWFGPRLVEAALLSDEKVYQAAFFAIRTRQDLDTVPGWHYPALTAALGARLAALVGDSAFFVALRLLNLAGVALVYGWSVALAPARWRPYLLPLVLLLPITGPACQNGNVSGLLVGLLLLSLSSPWRSFNLVTVGISLLFKPYGLIRGLALPWPGPLGVLGMVALGVLTSNSHFDHLTTTRNSSLIRALHELGLTFPWQVWSGLVLLGALWVRPAGSRALAWAWLSLPLVWDYTALLWIPLAAQCLVRPPTVAGDRRLGALLVLLVEIVLFYPSAWGLPDGPRWASGLLGLCPTLAGLSLLYFTRDAEKAVFPRGPGV